MGGKASLVCYLINSPREQVSCLSVQTRWWRRVRRGGGATLATPVCFKKSELKTRHRSTAMYLVSGRLDYQTKWTVLHVNT